LISAVLFALLKSKHFSKLDASGKSPAYIHRRNNQPAPGNRPRAFLFRLAISISDALKKILPRRANHRHIDIIAIIEPAPGNRSRAF
jgi:hypothetical protein